MPEWSSAAEIIRGDIAEPTARENMLRDAHTVVHLATRGFSARVSPTVAEINDEHEVTLELLRDAVRLGARRFIYLSSIHAYGSALIGDVDDLTPAVPTTESMPIQPQYPYALSKYQGEQAVLHWGQCYKLPVVSIRIFNAYGPRSKTTGAYGAVFGVFLAQKLAGKPFTVVGDGTQTRDFIFVTDLARAFYAAATSPKTNEIYNVGAGNPQPVNRLVELIGGPVIHIPKRPGEPDCTWADISKITRELGW